jgi:hypothetical protein
VLCFPARSAGTTVVILVLFSACSSQPSDSAKKESDPQASRLAASRTLQVDEATRLVRKAEAKDDALLFVRLAQNACRELNRKTEALTLDSTVDSSEIASFIPTAIYPTDPFAAYVDEATFAEVRSQLTELVSSVVALLRSLERSRLTSIPRRERQPEDVIKDRRSFLDQKLKLLASTQMYCESVRRAGAGVGTLR